MIKTRVSPVDKESHFSIEEVFFSVTNRKGLILFGNDVFERISHYEHSELIGEPHNIIRHPDVPRCVFQLLWDYLDNDKTIGAYVKNLAKNGSYYWVFALVIPWNDRLVSIRIKPTSAFLPIVEALYAEVLRYESAIEADPTAGRKTVITRSLSLVVDKLGELGFSSYDDFMHQALAAEMKARATAIRQSKNGTSANNRSLSNTHGVISSLVRPVRELYEHMSRTVSALESLETLNTSLSSRSKVFYSLTHAISKLSLNAVVESNRLLEEGATLSVVAESLGSTTETVSSLISEITETLGKLSSQISPLGVSIAISRLKIEVINQFLGEIIQREENPSQDFYFAKITLYENINLLIKMFRSDTSDVLPKMEEVYHHLEKAQLKLEELAAAMMTLDFIHFTGRLEASRSDRTQAFSIIFSEVANQVENAKKQLDEFVSNISKNSRLLSAATMQNHSVVRNIDSLLNDVNTICQALN